MKMDVLRFESAGLTVLLDTLHYKVTLDIPESLTDEQVTILSDLLYRASRTLDGLQVHHQTTPVHAEA